jgi:6,7-dimethyl-8-ribityllumazine synthase
MPKVIEGNLVVAGARFGVIVARFNEFITSKLLGACVDTLKRHGAEDDEIEVMWCPGAYEIPLVAKRAAESGRYDAVICLGAVIRGATPHFDYVAGECAKGIGAVGMATGVPTIFGVVTTDTIEQAIERAGTKAGNKGADSAMTAIEMVNLLRTMPEPVIKTAERAAARR